jgi:ferritin-like protein
VEVRAHRGTQQTDSSDALSAALAAEHAAIFGYGAVGGHLDRAGQDAARQAETAHRNRRDALVVRIAAASASPPAAAPAYALPFPVTDRTSALKLAVALEEGAAQAWRQALPATSGNDRRLALDALMDCAVQATRWRRSAGILPPTVPFPGAPA